jgi:tripartite-type tricarboxylate transporter receptor subunit TctC
VKEKLARSGTEYVMSSPEEFIAFLRTEIAKWTKLVKDSNIRIE